MFQVRTPLPSEYRIRMLRAIARVPLLNACTGMRREFPDDLGSHFFVRAAELVKASLRHRIVSCGKSSKEHQRSEFGKVIVRAAIAEHSGFGRRARRDNPETLLTGTQGLTQSEAGNIGMAAGNIEQGGR